MNGKFLLDTNIVIAFFLNDDCVIEKVSQASEIFLSNVTVGELYFGAYKSNKVEKNIRQIEKFIICNTILNCDRITAIVVSNSNQIIFEKSSK